MIKRLLFAFSVLWLWNSSASAAGVEICFQAPSGLNCVPVSAANPLPVIGGAGGEAVNIGQAATAGDFTITTGGTAQNIFGGVQPVNGFCVSNPNLSDDIWVSDTTTAAVNGKGSHRIAANGGEYCTSPAQKPVGVVSAIAPTTNDVGTAEQW